MKKLLSILLLLCITAAYSYAQKSFDVRYSEAESFYKAKDYDTAIRILNVAKKSPGVSDAQINKADALISRCRREKNRQNAFTVSKSAFSAPAGGMTQKITVNSPGSWNVLSGPDWCDYEADEKFLTITVAANLTASSRRGVVEIASGARSLFVTVSQAAGKVIHVKPEPSPQKRRIAVLPNNRFLFPRFACVISKPLLAPKSEFKLPEIIAAEPAIPEVPHGKEKVKNSGFMNIAGAEWLVPVVEYPTWFAVRTQNVNITKQYAFTPFGTAWLAKVYLLPGLSVNALEAAFYTDDYGIGLRSFSPFTNLEFRLGGGIKYADFAVLAKGVWYPDWTFLSGCVSGWDIFLGGEATSRFPVGNLYLRAGVKYMANMNVHETGFSPVSMSRAGFADNLQFTVSLGISLGTMRSCGQNILRVF